MINKDLSWQRRLLSAIIAVLCLPRRICQRQVPSSVRNILIIEWNYLGDMIAASPAIRAVKENYPDAHVILLTNPENKEYVDSFDFIDRALFIKNPLQLGRRRLSVKAIADTINVLRNEQYDLALELSGRLTTQFFLFFIRSKYFVGQDPTQDFHFLDKSVDSGRKHQIERNFDVLKLLGIPMNRQPLWDPAHETDAKFVDDLLIKRNIHKEYVVIHPVASWGPREWPSKNWKIIAQYLIDQGLAVIFVGTQSEFKRIEEINEGLDPRNSFNFAGVFNIVQLIAFMKKAAFFMGTDSGPMHIAAISNLKSMILFGPGDPQKWSYQKHTIIYKKPGCGPCAQLAYRSLCAEGLKTCKGLVEITPQEVIERIEDILS